MHRQGGGYVLPLLPHVGKQGDDEGGGQGIEDHQRDLQPLVIGHYAEQHKAHQRQQPPHHRQAAHHRYRHRPQKALIQIQLIAHHQQHQRAGGRGQHGDGPCHHPGGGAGQHPFPYAQHPQENAQGHADAALVGHHILHQAAHCGPAPVGEGEEAQKRRVGKHRLPQVHRGKAGLLPH